MQLLHDEASVLRLDYAEDGTVVEAVVKPELWAKVRRYSVDALPPEA